MSDDFSSSSSRPDDVTFIDHVNPCVDVNLPEHEKADVYDANQKSVDPNVCVDSGSNHSDVLYIKSSLLESQLRHLDLERKQLEYERQLMQKEIEVEKLKLRLKEQELMNSSRLIEKNTLGKKEEMISHDGSIRFGDPSADQDHWKTLITGLELPKVNLMPFDGSPTEYWSFMKQFEHNVESKLKSDGQRLTYLLYYCRGKAKEAISQCIMLPEDEGYKTALSILKDLFGRPHVVARALIGTLINNGRPIANTMESLSMFAIKMQNCSITLAQMNYVADLNALHTLESIVKRLPHDLQRRWVEVAEEITVEGREPTFDDLTLFVKKRANVAGNRFNQILSNSSNTARGVHNPQSKPGWNSTVSTVISTPRANVSRSETCPCCSLHHELTDCNKFKAMDQKQKWSLVKGSDRCYSCLGTLHQIKNCPNNTKCSVDGCQLKHHKLLHIPRKEGKLIENNQNANVKCAHTHTAMHKVYLGIVPVKVLVKNGFKETYALLDSGSDTTLVTEDLAEIIGETGIPSSLKMSTVNLSSLIETRCLHLKVQPLDGSVTVDIDNAYVVKSLPVSSLSLPTEKELFHWEHLRDIPMQRLKEQKVSLLIGCNVPEAHWILEQRTGERDEPYAIRTHLGWLVLGPGVGTKLAATVNCICAKDDEMLEKIHLWENSDFNDPHPFQKEPSQDDLRAMDIVARTCRLVDGHFEVGLPWKYDKKLLPDNFSSAYMRLSCLRKRFKMDENLYQKYKLVMDDHIRKGYVSKVERDHLNKEVVRWFLPHHPVFNPKKPDKLRIVFDCAAVFKGVSLNKWLLQGPDAVAKLIGVLMRFRMEPIAVAADIQEMFLQVKVPLEDRNALRFLWWDTDDIDQEPHEYEIMVHPFGATSSPFCANYALRKTLDQFGSDCSEVVKTAADFCFYVDDCLTSLPTIEEAAKFVREIKGTLQQGGFNLTKWVSNSTQIMNMINVDDRASSVKSLNFQSTTIERTLGLDWDVSTDNFRFRTNFPDKPNTKRGILSCISSLYDPLGLVAPVLLPAKLLMQRLHRLGIDWDETIPETDLNEWESWKMSMNQLDKLNFPRCIKPHGVAGNNIQLHVFCDASEVGYGAVAYLRYGQADGTGYCSLILGKSKVAPLKSVTIPRLELAAAVLATKLAELAKEELRNTFESITFWTDSAIVLYYIRNNTQRYCTYVANRLSIIHSTSDSSQWKHVDSKCNPADYASRGLDARHHKFKMWCEGPTFLSMPEDSWKMATKIAEPDRNLIELKVKGRVYNISQINELDNLLTHFSEWHKLLKSVAWLRRFVRYMTIIYGKSNDSLLVGRIKVNEIREASLCIVKIVQSTAFVHEMATPAKFSKDNINKASKLRKLNPIVIDGILRVGGRLQNLEACYDQKFPIILPNKHHITNLIIRHYHKLEGHMGATQVLASIRQRFWIVNGGVAVRRELNKCFECRKRNARLGQQIMAPLHPSRLQYDDYPFSTTGVDYFGPISVKYGRRLVKRYGCIFTCLKMRAVHIEIAHDMSTDSFIMAMLRFFSRRGYPNQIYSDNGSNFIGAERELATSLKNLSQDKIHNTLLNHNISWHFNPPYSSHRGGIWERMIRTTRKIFSAITKDQTLDDEGLCTFMTEVERIMNNRPIVPGSDDPKDLDALTPNKLLLLRGANDIFENVHISEIYSRRWKQVKYLARVFWKRWLKEYVPTLQTRQRWMTQHRNYQKGDLVLVSLDGQTRDKWPLGLIVNTIVSNDGMVRQVDVRTTKGIFRRDIRKLCFLEGTIE